MRGFKRGGTGIIDARVSTKKQLLGSGLDNQLGNCRHWAAQNSTEILAEFTKAYSGAKEERTDFEIVLTEIKRLQSTGNGVDFYIFSSIDRLTRRGSEGYQHMINCIRALGVQPVDTRGVIQPEINTLERYGLEYEWSVFSPSETLEKQTADNGKVDRRNLLTNMIGTEIGLVRCGYQCRRPLDGYRNTKVIHDGKILPAVEPDPERMAFYQDMFAMRAAGTHSDQEIVDHLNDHGFRSVPHKLWGKDEFGEDIIVGQSIAKPMTVKQLQMSVQRLLYVGVKLERWNAGQPVWAIMPDEASPIVDMKTFNQANRGSVRLEKGKDGNPMVRYGTEAERRIKRRKKFHPDYKYDKMIHCSVCQRPLKNSGKGNKGKLGTYYQAHHCDRTLECRKVTGRIPKPAFEMAVDEFLDRLRFRRAFTVKVKEYALAEFERRSGVAEQKLSARSDRVRELRERQDTLLTRLDRSTSAVVQARTEQEIEDLELQITELEQRKENSELKRTDFEAYFDWTLNLIEHPQKTLANNSDPVAQQVLFDLVFKGHPTLADIRNGTPKMQPVFAVSSRDNSSQSSLVTPQGLEWNTLETSVRDWKEKIEQLKARSSPKTSGFSHRPPADAQRPDSLAG